MQPLAHAKTARMILRNSQKLIRGLEVIYRRKRISLSLVAIPGDTDGLQFLNSEEVSLNARKMEWLIVPDDLVHREKLLEPSIGDEVILLLDGRQFTFSIERDDTEPVWKFSDGMQTFLSVRTVLTEITTP